MELHPVHVGRRPSPQPPVRAPRKPRGRPLHVPLSRELPPITVDQIPALFDKAKILCARDLAAMLDCSLSTAYRMLHEHAPVWWKGFHRKLQMTGENYRIVKMAGEQIIPDMKTIAQQVGCSIKQAREVVKRWLPELARRPPKLTRAEIIVAAFDSTEFRSVKHIAIMVVCKRATVYKTIDRYRPHWRKGWPPVGSRKVKWPGVDTMLERIARSFQAERILKRFETWDYNNPMLSREFYLAGPGYVKLHPDRPEYLEFLRDCVAGKRLDPVMVRRMSPRKPRAPRRKRHVPIGW